MQQANTSGDSAEGSGGGKSYGSAMVPLGQDYKPGDDDVLVGRGKLCRNHSGKRINLF